MQQKKLGEILYVFDPTPYVITEDTDAEVIKVQEESLKGFIELNESLADKIVKFNYKIMCVTTQDWMPYINEPDPTEFTLFIGGNYKGYSVKVNGEEVGVEGRIDGLQNGDVINFIPSDDKEHYRVSGNLSWDQDVSAWEIIMGNEDTGVSIEKILFNVTLNGTNLTDKVTIKINNEAVELAESYQVPENVWFEIFPTDDPLYYSLSSSPEIEWHDEEPVHWYTKDQDVTINLAYTAPAQTVVLTAPYDLAIFAEAYKGWVTMKQDSEDPTLEKGDVEYGKTYSVEQRYGIGEGKTVSMDPNYLTGEQGTVGVAFTIPNDGTATNCTITLTTKQDPELAWSANSATVDINNIQGYPTLSNPHSVTVTYSSSSPEIASINATNGAIVANQNGNTTISAIFAGDETYNASTVSYDLTVEGGGGESGSSDDQ